MGDRNGKFSDDNILNLNHGLTKHGMSRTRFYRIWVAMKQRCLDHNHPAYKNYGGRGIGICDRWLDFMNFKEDMFDSYNEHKSLYGIKNTTLDRIDVNGNYEPSNCSWATKAHQALNRRVSLNIPEVNSSELAVSRRIFRERVKNGWTIEEAKSLPRYSRRKAKNKEEEACVKSLY